MYIGWVPGCVLHHMLSMLEVSDYHGGHWVIVLGSLDVPFPYGLPTDRRGWQVRIHIDGGGPCDVTLDIGFKDVHSGSNLITGDFSYASFHVAVNVQGHLG